MHKQLVSVVLAGLVGGLAAAPQADAQTPAVTATTVNFFAGPSGSYPVVAQVPGGVSVSVFGCLSDFTWCDVGMPGLRGWVWGDFITYPFMGRPVPLMTYGARIGIPVVTFSLGSYWGNFYRDRPWFRNQAHWARQPPRRGPPPAIRPGGRPGGRPGQATRPPGRPGANATQPPGQRPGGGGRPPGAGEAGRPQNPGGGGNRPQMGGRGGGSGAVGGPRGGGGPRSDSPGGGGRGPGSGSGGGGGGGGGRGSGGGDRPQRGGG